MHKVADGIINEKGIYNITNLELLDLFIQPRPQLLDREEWLITLSLLTLLLLLLTLLGFTKRIVCSETCFVSLISYWVKGGTYVDYQDYRKYPFHLPYPSPRTQRVHHVEYQPFLVEG